MSTPSYTYTSKRVHNSSGFEFNALVTRDRVEVVGPCNMTLRLGYEEDADKHYSNLHEERDGQEVKPYTMLLFAARRAAVEAVAQYRKNLGASGVDRVAEPRIIAEQFIFELALEIGADKFFTVCQLNMGETEEGICHSHDFCDANMVMDEAMRAIGIDPLPADEDGMPEWVNELWNKSWDIAKESMRLRGHQPRN